MKIKINKRINWLEVLFCIMISALIILAFWIGIKIRQNEEYSGDYSKYTIIPGDTVYSIAKDLNTNEDLNKIIYKIRQDNNIKDCGNLQIGTKLKIRKEWN